MKYDVFFEQGSLTKCFELDASNDSEAENKAFNLNGEGKLIDYIAIESYYQ